MVDAGDLLSPGGPLPPEELPSYQAKARVIWKALKEGGIDAMAPGKADLALGVGFLVEGSESAQMPYVCANLRRAADGATVFPPLVTIARGDIKVGIFGLIQGPVTDPSLTIQDPAVAAREAVGALQTQGVRCIVLLANLNSETTEQVVQAVSGIDVIVSGSVGKRLFPATELGPVLVVSPGAKGKQLGRLELTLREGASGWTDEGATERDRARARQLKERISELKARTKTLPDPESRARLEAQTQYYVEQLATLDARKKKKGNTHGYVDQHISLSRAVADDPDVLKWVQEIKTLSGTGGAPSSPAEDHGGTAPGP